MRNTKLLSSKNVTGEHRELRSGLWKQQPTHTRKNGPITKRIVTSCISKRSKNTRRKYLKEITANKAAEFVTCRWGTSKSYFWQQKTSPITLARLKAYGGGIHRIMLRQIKRTAENCCNATPKHTSGQHYKAQPSSHNRPNQHNTHISPVNHPRCHHSKTGEKNPQHKIFNGCNS